MPDQPPDNTPPAEEFPDDEGGLGDVEALSGEQLDDLLSDAASLALELSAQLGTEDSHAATGSSGSPPSITYRAHPLMNWMR